MKMNIVVDDKYFFLLRTWGDSPAAAIVCPTLGWWYQHVAQRCANNHSLGVYTVCLGFFWIHKNVDKKCILNFKIQLKSLSAGYTASYKTKYKNTNTKYKN